MQKDGQNYIDDDVIILDFAAIFDDYLQCAKRYWIQFFLILVMVASAVVTYFNWQYKPVYAAKMTYTVTKTRDTYVDAVLAKRLSGSVSTITSTGEFKEELLAELDRKKIDSNYQISSTHIESANLFDIVVTSDNYQDANDILKAVEKIYPRWASKSNGTLDLLILDRTEASRYPQNPYSLKKSAAKGVILGGLLCFALATLYVITLKTVRKESDMRNVTGKNCISVIPEIVLKKRAKSTKVQLLVSNKRIDWGYQQSLLTARSRIEKQMEQEGKKVLLISSTLPQEGKSTIAVNLALAFARHNKKVLIMDGDLRNPSVNKLLSLSEEKKGLSDFFKTDATLEKIITRHNDLDVIGAGTLRGETSGILSETKAAELMLYLRDTYDYIIIDTPPAYLFADAALWSNYADLVVYVVRHDLATINEIKDGITAFIQSDKLAGYVINRSPESLFSNGYYGKYGYSRYRQYGKYRDYGNTLEKSSKSKGPE